MSIRVYNLLCGQFTTSPPESHLGRVHCSPSWQRMDSPASCAIPTAAKSNHSAMVTLHPHRSATCVLYVTLLTLHCPIPPKEKKSAPSITGYINPQSSNWNNGKMKIACNCAYVQTETFKFHLCLASFYCVFLYLFQLLRNRHAECQI